SMLFFHELSHSLDFREIAVKGSERFCFLNNCGNSTGEFHYFLGTYNYSGENLASYYFEYNKSYQKRFEEIKEYSERKAYGISYSIIGVSFIIFFSLFGRLLRKEEK
ncbi:MAG: hypothetical protein NTZ83_02140, partial [Candidatus Pacearchaeota archaeon]|nr:hypothetical protein [Candidatus Pacearchaeota archaeon]